MKRIITNLFLIVILMNTNYPQQIIWNHLKGPMGGIVGDIAINSKGDIYAGVYPYWNIYSGLFKSTDNGESWIKVITPFNDFEVYAIYITKEDHIWVGTNFQDRIYRSTDDGQTWEIKRNGYNTGECWAFGQSKDGILFAGDGQYQQLYRSTNYGKNWEFSAYLRPFVFATDSNNIVYAGTHDGLFATTDIGISWAQNNFFSNIPVSSILIDSSNYIYCGTGYYDNGNGVFYSRDGGQNWVHLGLAGKVVLSLSFDSNSNLLAGTLYDGLFKTTDMGKNWKQYQNGLYRKQVFRLRLNDNDDIFIGSEGEGVFRSTNNGESFEHIGLPISKVNNIVFSGDSLIFSSTPSGVQKYNRLTKKWTNLGLQSVEAISITPGNCLYAATFDEGLCKSTDLGATWSSIYPSADSLVYNVLAVNDDTLFAATLYNFCRTENAGDTWVPLSLQIDYSANGMEYSEFENSLFVSGVFNSNYFLAKSSDLGNSFNNVLINIGDVYLNSICLLNEYAFLATGGLDGAVYRSSDYGINWTEILNNINSRSVFVDSSGVILVGSLEGLYYSSDFGYDFSTLDLNLGEYNYVSEIKRNNKLFLGTSRTGLIESEIVSSINELTIKPISSLLFQNYPNPFNPSTVINYSVKEAGLVEIKVYDILGSEVAELVNITKEAGNYAVEFNAAKLPSSVYIYTMLVNGYSASQKMLLLK